MARLSIALELEVVFDGKVQRVRGFPRAGTLCGPLGDAGAGCQSAGSGCNVISLFSPLIATPDDRPAPSELGQISSWTTCHPHRGGGHDHAHPSVSSRPGSPIFWKRCDAARSSACAMVAARSPSPSSFRLTARRPLPRAGWVRWRGRRASVSSAALRCPTLNCSAREPPVRLARVSLVRRP